MTKGAMLPKELHQALLAFRRERDWGQFHTLRTLSTSLAIECAELMEITQWVPDSDLGNVALADADRIKDEVADIAILLAYLVNDLDIDVEDAVRSKLEKNAEKYPVDKARGVSTKYDRL